MTRDRLVKPTEGLIPTRLFTLLGERIEPSVSVPNAAKQRPIDDPTPEPEEEPDGSMSGSMKYQSTLSLEEHEQQEIALYSTHNMLQEPVLRMQTIQMMS